MDKSIDLIIPEIKDKIVSVLNESKLPITIISMIIHEISGVVDNTVTITIDKLKKEYDESLKKEKEV